ncbi:MAG: trypsin-like peptidase domain-containing protein [Verrucomicrobiales bacterium]
MKKSREPEGLLCLVGVRMYKAWMRITLRTGPLALALACCAPTPPPVVTGPAPGREVYREAAQRFAAIVVSERDDVDSWLGNHFRQKDAPKDADGGSAIPITSDGYFLTADHVLANADSRKVFVILRRDGRLRASRARVVWRSESEDLALIHSPVKTPGFYEWTPKDQWLAQGTAVMHAGIATGFNSSSGHLLSPIRPETRMSGNQRFKHDIPLEPGDSGGAVVDGRGLLVGVNSAVEFLVPLETAFFIESEANRPNIARLMKRIEKDRAERIQVSL